MRDRINKPRVFLSHSSLDKGFVERLASDLRRCHIVPWLDTEEIRDGRPWLKMIFEDGIPTCDALIVYLTDNSLNSKMVERELDATFVEQLSESGIVILPYVSRSELRGRVRSDIRALQCREWNEDNYHSTLPTVVAEIWRSYMERHAGTVALQERNRRLELELELQKNKEKYEAAVFATSEEKEFSYLHHKLDRNIELALALYYHKDSKSGGQPVGEEIYSVNLLSSLIRYINQGSHTFRKSGIEFYLHRELEEAYPTNHRAAGVNAHPFGAIKENLALELNTYGLAKTRDISTHDPAEYLCEFTDKMYRFKYWLEYNNIAPALHFEHVKTISISQGEAKDDSRDLAYVSEINDELTFQDRRAKWHKSQEGVLATQREVTKMYGELERLVNLSNEKLSATKVDFVKRSEHQCIISSRGRSLSIQWDCNHTDNLETSVLIVTGYEVEVNSDMTSELDGARTYYHGDYTVDLQRDSQITWRGKSDNQSLTSEGLAARFLSYFLNSIRNRAIHGD